MNNGPADNLLGECDYTSCDYNSREDSNQDDRHGASIAHAVVGVKKRGGLFRYPQN